MPSYSTRWSKLSKELVTDTTLTLSDLEEGVEYKFRVMAENEAGIGEPCEPITVIAKDPYGKSLQAYTQILYIVNLHL